MKISSLKCKNNPIWPPKWFFKGAKHGNGVLAGVNLRQNGQRLLYILVAADFSGDLSEGIIYFEDCAQLENLYHKLENNVGSSLAKIGDTEIDC
jgi:hypothetical protein